MSKKLSPEARDQMKFGVNHNERVPFALSQLDEEIAAGADTLVLTSKEFLDFYQLLKPHERADYRRDGLWKDGSGRYGMFYNDHFVYCAGFNKPQALLGLRTPK